MRSELNKRKEKKYYSNLNKKEFEKLKLKIERGDEIYDFEYKSLEGPDSDKLILYLKEYKNIRQKKNIGFEL